MSAIDTLLTRAQEISSDAERVTEAKLRKVTLPAVDGKSAGVLGLITLDNGEDHTKPNTFGPRGLISLNAAIDAALADDEVVAIGVTGKPFILAAGAAGAKARIRVIADPTIHSNIHELDVQGDCGRLRCRVESRPSVNPKTSELAVRSAVATLGRIFDSVLIGT